MYLCGTLFQGLTRPITPMGLAVLELMRNSKGPWRYVNPGLRMYVDLTAVVRSKSGRAYLLRMLPLADGRSGAVLPALLEDPRFGVIEHPFRGRPAQGRGRAPRARTAPAHRQHREIRQPRPHRRSPPGHGPVRCPARRRAAPGHKLRQASSKPGSGLAEPASSAQRLDYTERILGRTD